MIESEPAGRNDDPLTVVTSSPSILSHGEERNVLGGTQQVLIDRLTPLVK